MFRTTYPNKVFDYMAAGRPTVLVIDGVIREVIEASGGGVFVHPGDDKMLAEKVLDLAGDPVRVKQMGQAARDYLVTHLNRLNKMDETLELLKRLAA
jgi:glycosyltransferase involved in cell wall biosynthesis